MSKAIRILHVVNSLDAGGMENGVVNIIRELSGEFDFQVACLERVGRFGERLPTSCKAQVMGKQDGFSFRAAIQLGLVNARFRPDIIHTHNLGPLIYTSIATAGGIVGRILHGEHSQLTKEECAPRRLFQRRLLYRCCRGIHTVSHSQKEELVRVGFCGVFTIVNGVNTERFAPGSNQPIRTRLAIPADSILMGIVGRFGPFKGHEALLDAFTQICSEFPELHLLIVGAGGPLELRVRKKAEELPVRDRIHFAGYQSEMTPYYNALDFLVVPSVNEGLSNAVLEAKACGIPVLAHTACGNSEVIASGKEGIVVDMDSSEKLQNAVRTMIRSQKQFPSWREAARERAVREFSLRAMVEGYSHAYRTIALSNGASVQFGRGVTQGD